MAGETYDTIENPYDANLIRSGSPLQGEQSDGTPPTDGGVGSSSSNYDLPLSNERVWTSGWYKSRGYKPNEQGWLLEGAQGFGEFAELRVGRLGIRIVQTETGANAVEAIEIENASNTPAISVTKRGNGPGLYLRQVTDISNGFFQEIVMVGGASDVTFYVAENLDPNGSLSGEIGDVCFSTNGTIYSCQGGTVWTALGASSSATPAFKFVTDWPSADRVRLQNGASGGSEISEISTLGGFVSVFNTGGTGNEWASLQVSTLANLIFSGNPSCSTSVWVRDIAGADTSRSGFIGLGGDVTPSALFSSFTRSFCGFGFKSKADNTIELWAAQGNSGTNSQTLLAIINKEDSVDLMFDVTSDTSISYRYRVNGGTLVAATVISTNVPSSADTTFDDGQYQIQFIARGASMPAASVFQLCSGSFSYTR